MPSQGGMAGRLPSMRWNSSSSARAKSTRRFASSFPVNPKCFGSLQVREARKFGQDAFERVPALLSRGLVGEQIEILGT